MPCSPGMTKCKVLCQHRAFVEGYRDERQRQWDDGVERSGGYDTEIAEWFRDHPMVTFKQWMVQSARKDTPMDADRQAEQQRQWREEDMPKAPSALYDEEQVIGMAMAYHTSHGREMEGMAAVDPTDFTDLFLQHAAVAVKQLRDRGYRHDANSMSKLMTLRQQIPVQDRGQLPVRHAGGMRHAESPARRLAEMEEGAWMSVPDAALYHGKVVAHRSVARTLVRILDEAVTGARQNAMVEGHAPYSQTDLIASAVTSHMDRVRAQARQVELAGRVR